MTLPLAPPPAPPPPQTIANRQSVYLCLWRKLRGDVSGPRYLAKCELVVNNAGSDRVSIKPGERSSGRSVVAKGPFSGPLARLLYFGPRTKRVRFPTFSRKLTFARRPYAFESVLLENAATSNVAGK